MKLNFMIKGFLGAAALRSSSNSYVSVCSVWREGRYPPKNIDLARLLSLVMLI